MVLFEHVFVVLNVQRQVVYGLDCCVLGAHVPDNFLLVARELLLDLLFGVILLLRDSVGLLFVCSRYSFPEALSIHCLLEVEAFHGAALLAVLVCHDWHFLVVFL